MKPFDITSPSIIHCGAGRFREIPAEAANLGRRAAIFTGGHLAHSQLIADLYEALHHRGMHVAIAQPITSEPTVKFIDELSAFLREERTDLVISVGGGSVIDAAKAAAVMATNDGHTEAYQLRRREVTNPPLLQIAVPTTAGTGSEATRVSVLTNSALGIKRSVSHPLMTPHVAVLDPELTVSLPVGLTTLTAMDAFAHAIESAVCLKADSYTRHIAIAAIEQLAQGLPAVQRNLTDLDARLQCLIGSCFAGLAMPNGLGASHSLAPAICIVGGLRHSEAIAALLPHAIELNQSSQPHIYDQVSAAIGAETSARLRELCTAGGVPTSLAHYGMTAEQVDEVIETLNRYGSHRQTNPVEVTDDWARKLYELSLV